MQAKLPFNNLNAFGAAAATLSFQGAAELLHVTPSAVSHQIRKLESILGYKLFERLDKSVRLTVRGERLYLDIRSPLRQLHEASRNALRVTEDNTLALSVAPVFATRWLLPRLKGFYKSHPEINLSVVATTSMVNFRTDPFDAAIRMGNGSWPDTRSDLLFTRRIVAVCHPRLRAANGGSLSPKQLIEQALIHNSSMKGLWREWFRSAGVTIPAKLAGLEVQNSAQVLEAIASSDAIGLIDLSFIGTDLDVGGQLALACDHVLSGDDGYFLTCPEPVRNLSSLRAFAHWIFSQVGSDSRTRADRS